MIDPITLDLNALRARVLAGEILEPELARAAIAALRKGRAAATSTAATRGRSTKARTMTDDELLSTFDDLLSKAK
jgi:hypothetical protein